MSSLHKGVIILKKAHKQVPVEYLEKVLKENPSCGGMALAVFEKQSQLFCDTTLMPTLKFVTDAQSEGMFQDSTMLFHFGNYPKDFLKEDVQPFTVLSDDQGKPLMVAFLDGDFSRFAKGDSKHSAEFFAANTYLVPKIGQMFKMVGQDLPKLCTELQTPILTQEIGDMYKGTGNVILLAATKDILDYAGEEGSSEFTGFITSQDYGYREAAVAEPEKVTESEKPKTEDEIRREKLLAFKAGKAQETPKPAVSEPDPFKEQKEKVLQPVEEPEKKTNIPNLDPDKDGNMSSDALMYKFNLEAPAAGNQWAAPPLNSNNSTKKNWYNARRPNLPKGWKEGTPIQVPLSAIAAALAKATKPPTTATAIPADKSPLPASVPLVTKPEEKKEEAIPADVRNPNIPTEQGVPIPLLNPKLQEHLVDKYFSSLKIKAIIDADGEEVLNPDTLDTIESKYPDIITQLGLKSWSQLYRFDYPDIYEMAVKYPQLMAVLAFRSLLRNRRAELKELAQITVKGNIANKDVGTKHVPIPEAHKDTAPPAPRKSAFGRR